MVELGAVEQFSARVFGPGVGSSASHDGGDVQTRHAFGSCGHVETTEGNRVLRSVQHFREKGLQRWNQAAHHAKSCLAAVILVCAVVEDLALSSLVLELAANHRIDAHMEVAQKHCFVVRTFQ